MFALFKMGFEIDKHEAWREAFDWLKSQAETFHAAFSTKIRALPIKDEGGDENDSDGDHENG